MPVLIVIFFPGAPAEGSCCVHSSDPGPETLHATSRFRHAVAPCYRPLCNFAFSLFSRRGENRKERYGYAAFGGSADGLSWAADVGLAIALFCKSANEKKLSNAKFAKRRIGTPM